MVETYDAIMTRRSIGKAGDRMPARTDIERLLTAAIAAPNHHLTEPWRFVVLAGDALTEFGRAWGTGDERLGRDPAVAHAKARRAPVIIAVIERPNLANPKVVEIEEHHAVGAAMQNILLAAHDAGLAAMLRTGPAARLPEVREYLRIDRDEIIAGLIYVGYADAGHDRKAPRKTPASELTEWRGW